MKKHLLPCPFCGCAEPDISEVEFVAQIMCRSANGCNARVSALEESDAIAKWNKRTEIDPCDGCNSAPVDCIGAADCEKLKA